MNARRHGRRDAKARAIEAFIAAFNRMAQFLDVLSSAASGVPHRPSYFLDHATVRALGATIAQLKNELPPADADTGEWTRWLRRHRELGEALPDGLSEDVARVGLLTACRIWASNGGGS